MPTTGQIVTVFWRGAELVHVADLQPGESSTSNSYEGHSFAVQINGNIKYSFEVSRSFPVYRLYSTDAKLHHEL